MRHWPSNALFLSAASLVVAAAVWAGWQTPVRTAAAAEDDQNAQTKPAPVEEDDHEFMEYVFEPPFHRVKKALATQPQDKTAWKAIKSDSLIMAEAANLLLFRESAGDEIWDQASVKVRGDAGRLYNAARKADYAAARDAFKVMIASCNRCHEEYGGEDLKP